MKEVELYLTYIENASDSLVRWDIFYDLVINCFENNCRGKHIKTSELFFELKQRMIPEYREMTVLFARGQQLLAKSKGMDIYGDKLYF